MRKVRANLQQSNSIPTLKLDKLLLFSPAKSSSKKAKNKAILSRANSQRRKIKDLSNIDVELNMQEDAEDLHMMRIATQTNSVQKVSTISVDTFYCIQSIKFIFLIITSTTISTSTQTK